MMHKKIVSIVQMFPDFEEKIDFLFQTDENFRDLCSDHILCVAMLQGLKTRLDKNAPEVEEYKDLQRKLEQEILEIILKTKHNP